MEVNKRRGGGRGSVVAGSVWESRMKSDEVRGGIKVFNAEENPEEGGGGGGNNGGGSKLRRSSIGCATVASAGKRKTWKSESSDGLDKNPILVTRGKPTETQKNSEEQCKELSISSSDGIKKSPIQTKKIGASSADKPERSPIKNRKLRSDSQEGSAEVGKEGGGESAEGHARNAAQLRKTKSDSIKKNASGPANSSIQLRKVKSELGRVVPDGSRNEADGMDGGCEKIELEKEENDAANENCKDFDVCQEKGISSSSDNVGVVQSSAELSVQVVGDSDDVIDDEVADERYDEEEEQEEDVVDGEIEIEMEKESFEVKEISISESKVVKEPENNKVVVNEPDKKVVISEPENKKIVNEPEKKVVNEPEPKKVVNEPEPKKVVSAHMRFHHRNERRPVSVPLALKQSPTIRRNSTIYQNFSEANSSKDF